MKTKNIKIIISSVAATGILILLGLLFTGFYVGWGPFAGLSDIRLSRLEGNAPEYSAENIYELESSPLKNKKICYLGSSVTYGSASQAESFAEMIAKRNATAYVKEAVSGTTLVDDGADSYISRLKKLDTSEKYDLFVCQLSTNDAAKNKTLGAIDSTDTSTICGAIHEIINYVRNTWGCPVVFFTNAYYDNENYAAMVEAVKKLSQIENFTVIDLYTDKDFNQITDEQRSLYMADKIHPTKAGYLEWWTPKMEQEIYKIFD